MNGLSAPKAGQSLVFLCFCLTLHPVKAIAVILSLVMLSSTIIPCSVFDNCAEETCTTQTSDAEDQDCKDCSPFSVCSPTSVLFTYTNTNAIIVPAVVNATVKYSNFSQRFNSEYYSRPFQPPRQS